MRSSRCLALVGVLILATTLRPIAPPSSTPSVARAQPGSRLVLLPTPGRRFALNLPLVIRERPTSLSDPVLVGAGDIASCYQGNVNDEATAKLLDVIPGTV